MSIYFTILLKINNCGREKIMKTRDFHKLAIIRKEARGYTTAIASKKLYKRKEKHPKRLSYRQEIV